MLSILHLQGGGRVVILMALAVGLAACSGLKEQFGMGKNSPDEFRVVKRAPLTLPPDFTLRPPTPGARRPQETSVQDRAKAALYGATAQSNEESVVARSSLGEEALLARAGTTEAMPGIRRIINEDNALYAEDDETFIDKLIFWQKQEPNDTIVDPAKEAQRLQEASALGNPPNQGQTAVIKRRKKAIFEGIFEQPVSITRTGS